MMRSMRRSEGGVAMNFCGSMLRKAAALCGITLALCLTASGTVSAAERVSAAESVSAASASEMSGTVMAADMTNPAGAAENAVPLDNTLEIAGRPGMVGRLYIPDCDISVAYFDATYMDLDAQNRLIDGEDQGALIAYDFIRIVGDHNYQGFINIMQAVRGETLAYMLEGETLRTYVCIEADFGKNMIYQLTDVNGVSIEDRDSETLITYTCYTDWQDIYYCAWIPVEDYLARRKAEEHPTAPKRGEISR